MRGRTIAAVLCLAGLAGAWIGLRSLQALEPPKGEEPLLYLPNGQHLKVASMGHPSLVADFVYLWAIQFYSDYERGDRFRYVEHVFGNVIPELDPHYLDSYSLGTLILTVEARDLDAGLRIIERGMEENPGNWMLPYLAGWECYQAKEFKRAAAYMEIATSLPGAPVLLLRNRAGFVAKTGDLREAYALWSDLYEDPASDQHTRTVAERQMRDLHVRIDLDLLRRAIAAFRTRYGRNPSNLDQLSRAGILQELPDDPDGNPYPYDPSTGAIDLEAGRILGES